MLGNISDCVKKIFLYFTTSLILAWISLQIIHTRVYFIAMNTSQSDLNESSKRIYKKLIYVCSFNFMYVVLVRPLIRAQVRAQARLLTLSLRC